MARPPTGSDQQILYSIIEENPGVSLDALAGKTGFLLSELIPIFRRSSLRPHPTRGSGLPSARPQETAASAISWVVRPAPPAPCKRNLLLPSRVSGSII